MMKMLAAIILPVLLLIFTLPTPPAGAGDFGATVTLPDNNHSEWATANHKLDDNGTTVTVTDEYTLSGVISGSGGLTINGHGPLTLSGDNTYTGGTQLKEGGAPHWQRQRARYGQADRVRQPKPITNNLCGRLHRQKRYRNAEHQRHQLLIH